MPRSADVVVMGVAEHEDVDPADARPAEGGLDGETPRIGRVDRRSPASTTMTRPSGARTRAESPARHRETWRRRGTAGFR